MHTAPGLEYLAKRVPRFVLHTALAFGVIRLANRLLDLDLPPWLIIALSVGSRPLILLVDSQTADWRAARRAMSLGGSLAPKVEGSPYEILKDILGAIDDAHPERSSVNGWINMDLVYGSRYWGQKQWVV